QERVEQVAYSPDGKVLASVVAYAPDGKVLAPAGVKSMIQIWDMVAGKRLHGLQTDDRFDGPVTFSPDGKLLVSSGASGSGKPGWICLWDPATGKEVKRWRASEDMTAVAFAPDGKVLASVATFENHVRRWDPATGKEIDPVARHTKAVGSLRFAPDGKGLMSLSAGAQA